MGPDASASTLSGAVVGFHERRPRGAAGRRSNRSVKLSNSALSLDLPCLKCKLRVLV
jgi:hypothetical protein